MSDLYTICYRITYFLARSVLFGFLHALLVCFVDIGTKNNEEILTRFAQEQRDCENIHHYVTDGAKKLFYTALLFVLASR